MSCPDGRAMFDSGKADDLLKNWKTAMPAIAAVSARRSSETNARNQSRQFCSFASSSAR
jgi:hypothetical protein